MLSWLNQFNICCLLDNQQYILPHHSVECIAAAGVVSSFSPGEDFFSSLATYTQNNHDYIFGHFNYDLKNEVENLTSANLDSIQFPDVFLFVPEVVLKLQGDVLEIGSLTMHAEEVFEQICSQEDIQQAVEPLSVNPRLCKEDYIKTVQQLQQHILRGDCYEITFCQEFFAEAAIVNPPGIYFELARISPNPFTAYYKLNDKYLLCASPERYLQKKGRNILSQPIKGTSQRAANIGDDEKVKQDLLANRKERSENVMIVDLVRNDLSKVCEEGTVVVDELFGIYTFPQVHQMISTISGRLKGEVGLSEILQATFPMGSMTGAPKKKVMELIEEYETVKRGIFSGSVGYITPEKDFDFNVVIRSILYNATQQYLCYLVGSAITYYSNPEKEYEECLLKAFAMEKIFS